MPEELIEFSKNIKELLDSKPNNYFLDVSLNNPEDAEELMDYLSDYEIINHGIDNKTKEYVLQITKR